MIITSLRHELEKLADLMLHKKKIKKKEKLFLYVILFTVHYFFLLLLKVTHSGIRTVACPVVLRRYDCLLVEYTLQQEKDREDRFRVVLTCVKHMPECWSVMSGCQSVALWLWSLQYHLSSTNQKILGTFYLRYQLQTIRIKNQHVTMKL